VVGVVQRRQSAAVIEKARALCAEAEVTRSRSREILDRSMLLHSHEPPWPVDRQRRHPAAITPVVVCVTGELDMAAVPALSAELHAHLCAAAAGTDLVVDLRGVTFIDLHGLTLLLTVTATARSRGVGVELVGRPRCLLRLLEITGATGELSLR
jgi:anti-anti-sigma factor